MIRTQARCRPVCGRSLRGTPSCELPWRARPVSVRPHGGCAQLLRAYYSQFVADFDRAVQRFAELRAANRRFDAWVVRVTGARALRMQCTCARVGLRAHLKRVVRAFAQRDRKADPRCRTLDFASFFIMPIQRVPRYVLLLNELLARTAQDEQRERLSAR